MNYIKCSKISRKETISHPLPILEEGASIYLWTAMCKKMWAKAKAQNKKRTKLKISISTSVILKCLCWKKLLLMLSKTKYYLADKISKAVQRISLRLMKISNWKIRNLKIWIKMKPFKKINHRLQSSKYNNCNCPKLRLKILRKNLQK